MLFQNLKKNIPNDDYFEYAKKQILIIIQEYIIEKITNIWKIYLSVNGYQLNQVPKEIRTKEVCLAAVMNYGKAFQVSRFLIQIR